MPRRVHRRRARRRAAGRLPDPERIGFHGNNKSVGRAGARARARGRPDHRRLLPRDRAARRARLGELERAAPRDGAGHRRRRGAHPRVHRHRARGPEVRLLDQQRRRARGGPPDPRRPTGSSCSGCTPTSARRSSTPPASRSPPAGCWRCTRRSPSEIGVELAELDLGGGFGIAYTTQDDPSDAAQLAIEMTKIVERRVPGPRPRGAAAVHRARPGDRRPGDVHRLRGRHGQGGRARRRRGAHLRLRRRRDERQHPHRALRRRLLLHPRQPRPPTRPRCWPGVVGKHCEAGDIVVKDEFLPGDVAPATWSRCPAPAPTAARWPATTTTLLRPPVVAVKDGTSRVVVRRETEDDLLATDLG